MIRQDEQELPDLSPIFTAPVRWGFEFVQPTGVMVSPERAHPPAVRPVATVSAAGQAGIEQLPVMLFAGAGIALLLTIISVAANVAALYFIVGFIAAGVSLWATSFFRSKVQLGIPGAGEIIGLALASFFIPPLGLFVQGLRVRQHSVLLRQQRVPDPADVAAAQREHEQAVADWQRRVVEFEQSEQRRFAEADRWFPVVPSPGSHLICAFGGPSRTYW